MGHVSHQGTVTSGRLLISTCGGSRRASSKLKSKSASGGAHIGIVAPVLLLVLLPPVPIVSVPLQLSACCEAAAAAAEGFSLFNDGPSAKPPATPAVAPARSMLSTNSPSACLSGAVLQKTHTTQ